jgi:hypothetical protein
MVAAAEAAPRLDDEQVVELVHLTRDVDSVELKLTVPAEERHSAVAALGMDPLDSQIRQVFFFDTPDLRLDEQGAVVRARRIQRKGDDTVVKLRPVVPADLPTELRESPGFNVEVDAMPGGFVCSATMKRMLKQPKVRDAVAGELAVSELFSKRQRRLLAQHAPGVELDELEVLGPIFVLKLKGSPPGYDRRLVGELWLYPDMSSIIELSTKCDPSEAFQVAAETRAFLTERGIDLGGEQQTKTRKALEFFSERLRTGGARLR